MYDGSRMVTADEEIARDNQIPWQRRIPLGVSKRVGASDFFSFFSCWRLSGGSFFPPSGPAGRRLGNVLYENKNNIVEYIHLYLGTYA